MTLHIPSAKISWHHATRRQGTPIARAICRLGPLPDYLFVQLWFLGPTRQWVLENSRAVVHESVHLAPRVPAAKPAEAVPELSESLFEITTGWMTTREAHSIMRR